jgi:copper chaperone
MKLNTIKLELKVPEISCGGCVNAIANAVKTLDANAIVQGNPTTKIVSVETQASETAIREAIAKIGYPAD